MSRQEADPGSEDCCKDCRSRYMIAEPDGEGGVEVSYECAEDGCERVFDSTCASVVEYAQAVNQRPLCASHA